MDDLLAWEGPDAHRDDVDVKVALSALLFAPFCEFGVSSWDETEASGGVRRVCQLFYSQWCYMTMKSRRRRTMECSFFFSWVTASSTILYGFFFLTAARD